MDVNNGLGREGLTDGPFLQSGRSRDVKDVEHVEGSPLVEWVLQNKTTKVPILMALVTLEWHQYLGTAHAATVPGIDVGHAVRNGAAASTAAPTIATTAVEIDRRERRHANPVLHGCRHRQRLPNLVVVARSVRRGSVLVHLVSTLENRR